MKLYHISNKFGNFDILIDNKYSYLLENYSWSVRAYFNSNSYKYYVAFDPTKRNNNLKNKLLHRIILNCKKHQIVDHIDGNGLNNQLCNIRVCTQMQNTHNTNRHKDKTSSKYKGVFKSKEKGRRKIWKAEICFNGKRSHLGWFTLEKEAALAYNEAAIKYFGEFAKPNKIE